MPKFNWKPEQVIFMDLETQSYIDLRKWGSRVYARHPSTRVMSAVFQFEGGRPIVWITPDAPPVGYTPGGVWIDSKPPQQILDAIAAGATFVAHNAEGFDSLVWESLYPQYPATWFDTIPLCRAAGFPAKLHLVAQALGRTGKHQEGMRAMKLLTRGTRKGFPTGTPALWDVMLEYNAQDVEDLIAVYHAVKGFADPEILSVHSLINERGILLDPDLIDKLQIIWAEYQQESRQKASAVSENGLAPEDVASPAKVKRWLAGLGFAISSLERGAVEQMLDDPEGFFGDTDTDKRAAKAVAVLSARVDAIRTTPGKLERALSVLDADQRARGLFVMNGAHTGRWSSKDLQVHNFPRGVNGVQVEGLLGTLTLDSLRAEATRCKASVGDVLATLTRPIICAPPEHMLCICDYAGIEARGTAWIADDKGLLKWYENPKSDPYCEMASLIFRRPITKKDKDERQIGKVIVLGCGYGMGPVRFESYCAAVGVDLKEAKLTGMDCVQLYREQFPRIPNAWRALYLAARQVVAKPTESYSAARCKFHMDGGALFLTLPSGRQLVYREVKIEPRRPGWDPQGALVDALTYASGRGYRATLYGGLLMENVVQAVCNDLLRDAMVRLNPVVNIVAHVHDEIIAESPLPQAEAYLRLMAKTMATAPAWVTGFPIRVEGYTCPRYSKSPFSVSKTVDCDRGEFLV